MRAVCAHTEIGNLQCGQSQYFKGQIFILIARALPSTFTLLILQEKNNNEVYNYVEMEWNC